MKKLLFPAVAVMLFSSCGDEGGNAVGFSKPQLRNPELDVKVSTQFPEERTITDLKGRSIHVRLIAKKGNQVAFEKLPTLQRFVLPLEKLSRADQSILAGFADGGDLAAFETRAVQRDPNRRAVWHSQIANAEKEAAQTGLPMLVAVFSGDDQSSAGLEKNLVYSRDFKEWADRNVALCLKRVGSDSREGTFKTWQTLAKYGIPQSKMSSLTLISSGGTRSMTIPEAGTLSADQVMSRLKHAVQGSGDWAAVSAADGPVRASSPFKVNGGAKIRCVST